MRRTKLKKDASLCGRKQDFVGYSITNCTAVRYTGSSLAFSFAGILGASVAPYIATWLAKTYSLQYVGFYLSAISVLSFLGLLLARPTPDPVRAATLTNADPDPIL